MSQPDEINAVAQTEFTIVRRGYDPDEVQRVLAQARAAIAAAQTRDVDDNELMLRLGDKTVRVLEAARESAAEVERRSEERAAAALERAKEQVQRLQSQAEKELETARSRAATVEKESERTAHEVVKAAQAEADHMTTEAEETLRATRAEADRIEAEVAERADKVRAESSELGARAKGKVDALITKTRTQIEQQKAAAEDEVGRLRLETETAIEKQLAQAAEASQRLLDDAAAKAARINRQADARYEERVAAGRQLGRTLVAEAEAKRTEVLQDLGRTRRRANLNIEQLRVGRERLLEAFVVTQTTIEEATARMDDSFPEAKRIAEQMVARVGDDEDRSLEDLEAEFQLDRLRDLQILSDDDDPERTRAGAEFESAESGSDEDEVVTVERAGVGSPPDAPAAGGPGGEMMGSPAPGTEPEPSGGPDERKGATTS